MNEIHLEPPCRNKPKWGRTDASFFVKITFFWVFDLLRVSKKRQLVEDDIDEITQSDSSEYLLHKFLQEWDKQLLLNPKNPSLPMALLHTIGLARFIFTVSTLIVWVNYNQYSLSSHCKYEKFDTV